VVEEITTSGSGIIGRVADSPNNFKFRQDIKKRSMAKHELRSSLSQATSNTKLKKYQP